MDKTVQEQTDILDIVVSPAEAGERLDRFLSGRLGGLSRSRALTVIRSRLLGAPLKPGSRVRAGQVLRLALRVKARREPDFPLRVLHHDSSMVVVDKPAGQLVHPPRRGITNTLVEHLEREFGGNIRFPHRLDRETSGVLVAARTVAAARSLSLMFQNHTVEKRYLAVVEGTPDPAEGMIDRPLGRDPHSPVHDRQRVDPEKGRPASTRYRTLRSTGIRSLVEARPRTGRLHQIRVHLASIGTPLVGDKIYGADEGLFLRLLGRNALEPATTDAPVSRHALHAASLELRHPDTGLPMEFHAPLPQDMATLLL